MRPPESAVARLRNEKKRDERRARASEWTARRRWWRSPRRCASRRQTAWQLSDLFIRLRTHTCAEILALARAAALSSAIRHKVRPRLSPRAARRHFLACEINSERVMRILKRDRIRSEFKPTGIVRNERKKNHRPIVTSLLFEFPQSSIVARAFSQIRYTGRCIYLRDISYILMYN